MADLKTDYKDDVLDTSQNINRTFTIKDSSGNILYQDCQIEETTVFETEGDEMNAQVINNTNTEVNNLNDNLTASDDLKFEFMTDGDGNYGYRGADDSFVPFKSGGEAVLIGTYTDNATIDVSDFDATSADQFFIEVDSGMCQYLIVWNDWHNPATRGWYVEPVKTLSGNTLTITAPMVQCACGNNGSYPSGPDTSTKLAYSVYYVGDVKPYVKKGVNYLGIGQTFNLQTMGIAGWQNLTVDDFICEPLISSGWGNRSGRSDCMYPRVGLDMVKTYDATTGILTSRCTAKGDASNGAWYENTTYTIDVKAYLVVVDN